LKKKPKYLFEKGDFTLTLFGFKRVHVILIFDF